MTLTTYELAKRAVEHVAVRRHLPLDDRARQEIAHAVVQVLPVERPAVHLTRRRLAVLRLAARGLTNAEISVELGVAEYTVKSHMELLLRDLGARDRTHAVGIGFAMGLLVAGDVPLERVR